MESLLKELYYKNIKIKSDGKTVLDEEKELVRLIDANLSKLEASLNAEQKDRLKKLIDCYNEFFDLSCRNEFVCGVRFGGKIVAEMLSKD